MLLVFLTVHFQNRGKKQPTCKHKSYLATTQQKAWVVYPYK